MCGWISIEVSLLCIGLHLAVCQCLCGEIGIYYLFIHWISFIKGKDKSKSFFKMSDQQTDQSRRGGLVCFREDSVTNSYSSLGWHDIVICLHHMFIILNSLGEDKQKLCLLLEGPIGNIILGRKFKWWIASLRTSIKPRQQRMSKQCFY